MLLPILDLRYHRWKSDVFDTLKSYWAVYGFERHRRDDRAQLVFIKARFGDRLLQNLDRHIGKRCIEIIGIGFPTRFEIIEENLGRRPVLAQRRPMSHRHQTVTCRPENFREKIMISLSGASQKMLFDDI